MTERGAEARVQLQVQLYGLFQVAHVTPILAA